MNIYIDESGSINNHCEFQKYFIICLVKVDDPKKVKRAYKRFVSSNYERLKELDAPKVNRYGKLVRDGNKMFHGDSFVELKGAQFDREMKNKFVEVFSRVEGLQIYYICLDNTRLQDGLVRDISTAFNYPLRLAIEYFIKNGFLPDTNYHLQLDERNEKTDKRYFLEQYLNTELNGRGITHNSFQVSYFDSSNNHLIQIADVFANLYYSHMQTSKYTSEINLLKEQGILKFVFNFPLSK